MAQVWYCLIDGREFGPVNSHQLRSLAASGQLKAIHYVRQNREQPWINAIRIQGLFHECMNGGGNGPTALNPAARWFVRIGDLEEGPFTDGQLRSYAMQGQLKPCHEVRTVGEAKWTLATTIENLFPPTVPVTGSKVTEQQVKIRFTCPSCGKFLQCKPTLAGKRLPCPSCKRETTVPEKSTESNSKSAPEINSNLAKTSAIEDPAVVVRAVPTAVMGERIPAAARSTSFTKRVTSLDSSSAYAGKYPDEPITFFGPDTKIDLGHGTIQGPMVYVSSHRPNNFVDASLIELPLHVGRYPAQASPLPYWPTYCDSTPAQRARYLEWIYGGRSNPATEIGYVFLYFYGLERRVLVDGQDHSLIASELLRLLSIYQNSRSFIRYATTFLWLTISLSPDSDQMADSVLSQAIASTPKWTDTHFRYCLGYFARHELPLPAQVIYAITDHDERSANSVVSRRHSDKFRELFASRVAAKFPNGFHLEQRRLKRKLEYRPASGTLMASANTAKVVLSRTIPDALAANRQFLPLVKIWNECIEQLKDFDRAKKRAAVAATTGEMYEALPPELREGDHPEAASWEQAINECIDEGGWPVMPVSKLAAIKSIPRRQQLTKKQSHSLLVTADILGIAIEPDSRHTNRNYRWDEPVVVFRNLEGTASKTDMTAYHSAAILLRLGLSVAQADGAIQEAELTRITEHLEQEFDLGLSLSRRLEALQHLLVVKKVTDVFVSRALRQSLSLDQRRLVGTFLLAIAALDQVVCVDEREVLRTAFRNLGLPIDELDLQLASYDRRSEESDDSTPSQNSLLPPRLNLERIRAIHEETTRVQNLLQEVLSQVDMGSVESEEGERDRSSQSHEMAVAIEIHPAVSNSTVQPVQPESLGSSHESLTSLNQLPAQYQKFCALSLARERWTREEIGNLARQEGLMLNAAIEVINEWSMDTHGDWLIEEILDEVVVRSLLLGIQIHG